MLIWFILGVTFLIIEFFTFGIVSIWFSLGAFFAMFFDNLVLEHQFYIFVVVSLFSLIVFRKLSLKYLTGNQKEINRIEKKIVKIENLEKRGRETIYTVYLDGKLWEAISDLNFNTGEEAEVKSIKGNKLELINIKN